MSRLSKTHRKHTFHHWGMIFTRLDLMQIIAVIALLTVSVFFIRTTDIQLERIISPFWKKQIVWIGVGIVAWTFFAFTNYKLFQHWWWIVYLLAIILLIAVLIPEIGIKIKGARRWLQFGGIRFQPSELGKFAVIISVSFLISIKDFSVNKSGHLFLLIFVVAIPFVLIAIEPDLGSALVIFPLVASLLFVAEIKWKYAIPIILIVMSGYLFRISVFETLKEYKVLKEYQLKRIEIFLNPESDIKGRGWHQYQANLAVGSGGFWGKGLGNGTQNTLGYLPETHTDFIFSVIAEEGGFIGCIILLGLYGLLFLSVLRAAIFARDRFGRALAIGIGTLLFFHTFVNIGMSIGLTPVTGLPLPLVSYGGSFIVITMMYLGILQSIYAHRKRMNEGSKNVGRGKIKTRILSQTIRMKTKKMKGMF